MPASVTTVRPLRRARPVPGVRPGRTIQAVVRAVRRVRSDTVRITLAGTGPAGLAPTGAALGGPGDWCTVTLPHRVQGQVARQFTVRAARPDAAHPERDEIDLDVVRHDVTRPGGGLSVVMRWLAGVRCGDTVGLGPGGPGWLPRRPAGAPVLLVADATALPAACAMAEHRPADSPLTLVGEVAGAWDEPAVVSCAALRTTWAFRGRRPAGEPFELLDALDLALAGRGPGERAATEAWVAGEAASVGVLARYLVERHGLRRASVTARAYWRRDPALLA